MGLRMASHLCAAIALQFFVAGCAGGSPAIANTWQTAGENARAANVILFIGDGMGPVQVNSASLARGQVLQDGQPPQLFFETLPHSAVVTTYSRDSLVTDSAASATSLASGIKTDNGYINVDAATNEEVQPISAWANANGMATGVVSSVSLNHATPAAFYAHTPSRNEYADIIDDYFASPLPDVLFGGGVHGDPSLEGVIATKASENDVVLVTDLSDIDEEQAATRKVIGYFDANDNNHLEYMNAADRLSEPELSDLTLKALDLLTAREKPFFLMVEGGAIDWAGHANDGQAVVAEVLEFDDTVEKTVEYLQGKGLLQDTLIIVTSDHETGGMGLNGPYKSTASSNEDLEFGWTSTNHTAVPVPLYAAGPGAARFGGKIDQTFIHTVMKEALE